VTRLWVVLALAASAAKAPAPPGDGGVAKQTLARPVVIDADKFRAYGGKQEAEWVGHVRVRRDSTTIHCEALVAHYNQAHEFTRIVCDGSVEALDGERRMKGDHADFDNETGILVMTPARAKALPDGGMGPTPRVEIWDGKTHLWGDQATFKTGEKLLEVVHATTVVETPRDGGR